MPAALQLRCAPLMTAAPQILVVTGESSGDAHASELVAALQARRPDLRFFGMGGSRLAARGVELLYSAQEVSVMGSTSVMPITETS